MYELLSGSSVRDQEDPRPQTVKVKKNNLNSQTFHILLVCSSQMIHISRFSVNRLEQ